jgi:hypothetical protein
MKTQNVILSRISKIGAKPSRISFADYVVERENWRPVVEGVRNGTATKDRLPAIIPAGVFVDSYRAEGLRRPNGFASFDIDGVENLADIRARLTACPWVYYLEKSCSGKGLWGLVRFQDPSQYVFHYGGLIKSLEDMGIQPDYTGANIYRLRYYSYDEDPYLNEEATIFARMEHLFSTPDGVNVDYRVKYDKPVNRDGYSVIKRFNEQYDCESLFIQAGWKVSRLNAAGQIDVTRPGSTKSRSGNIKNNGFWCFTDNSQFKRDTLNRPFDCYVFLFHNGDISRAIRDAKHMV